MSDKVNNNSSPDKTVAPNTQKDSGQPDTERAESPAMPQDAAEHSGKTVESGDQAGIESSGDSGSPTGDASQGVIPVKKSSRPVTGASETVQKSSRMEAPQEEPSQGDGAEAEKPEPVHAEAEKEPAGGGAVPAGEKEIASPNFVSEDDVPPGACARIFKAFAQAGPLIPFLAICCMVWPDFWQAMSGAAYYCPAEDRSITAFLYATGNNALLTPHGLENGVWQPQWPAYTWYLWLLSLIPGLTAAMLFPLATSLAAFLAVLGVWGFSRAAGFGSEAALASAVILLCSPLFALTPHFVGPMTLSCALMLLSLMFLCYGWRHDWGWISLACGFLLAGLAGLAGGLFYLCVPLAASVLFLFWQARWHRAQKKDALLGFVLMLAMFGAWGASIILLTSAESYLGDLVASDWRFYWPPNAFWWLAMAIAVAGFTPWVLEIFGVSWARVMAGFIKNLVASRFSNGAALVWISLALACLATPFFDHPVFLATALVCLAAPLFGRAFMLMPPVGNRVFFFLASLCLIAAGLVILVASFSFSQSWLTLIWPSAIPAIPTYVLGVKSLPIIGGLCLLGGLVGIFVFSRRNHGGGGLIYSLLLTVVLCQPAVLMLAPELGANPAARLNTYAQIQELYKKAMSAPTRKAEGAPEAASATVAPEKAAPAGEAPTPAEAAPEGASASPAAPETPPAATPDKASETPDPASATEKPETPVQQPENAAKAPAGVTALDEPAAARGAAPASEDTPAAETSGDNTSEKAPEAKPAESAKEQAPVAESGEKSGEKN